MTDTRFSHDIVLPDYDAMAMKCKNMSTRDIAYELRVMFEKGYHLGLNKGWIIEQELDLAEGGEYWGRLSPHEDDYE